MVPTQERRALYKPRSHFGVGDAGVGDVAVRRVARPVSPTAPLSLGVSLVLQRDIWSWAEISQALEASFAMGSVGGSLVALLVAEERQCRLQVDRR